MNTQVYLMLVRDEGKWKDFYDKSGSFMKAALFAPKMLSKFVKGDSLDLPFLGFIKVNSVSHSISFPGVSTTYVPQGATAQTSGTEAAGYDALKWARSQKDGDTSNWDFTGPAGGILQGLMPALGLPPRRRLTNNGNPP